MPASMPLRAPPILIVDDNLEFADLVGTLMTEQGFAPILAHTGADAMALAARYAPVAIALDLLLPDVVGHKLIRQLHRPGGPPLFVMTGVFKGQSQMDKVTAIAPVSGWYEKPFDTRLLVEDVVRRVGRSLVVRDEHQRASALTPEFDIQIFEPREVTGIRAEAGVDPLEGIEIDEDASGGLAFPLDTDEGSTRGPAIRGGVVEALAVPEGSAEEPTDDLGRAETTTDKASIPHAARGHVSPEPSRLFEEANADFEETRSEISGLRAGQAKDEDTPTPSEVRRFLRAKVRRGDIRAVTVARLLTAFFISRETGEIAFERSGDRKIVYFHDGRPIYARSNQATDRLGSVARRSFGLTSEQIRFAVARAEETDRMTGDILIERGWLDESKRGQLLFEQTRAIIRSLIAWDEGRYVIGFNPTRQIRGEPLNEHPADLVLQAVRDLFRAERLRSLVPDDLRPMPSPHAPYELHELSIGDAEALLVLRATGTHTVQDLVRGMHGRLGERAVRAGLFALLALGVLITRRASVPACEPGLHPSEGAGT